MKEPCNAKVSIAEQAETCKVCALHTLDQSHQRQGSCVPFTDPSCQSSSGVHVERSTRPIFNRKEGKMRRSWKRTTCLFIGAVLLIGLAGLISSQSGSHAIAQDPPPPPGPGFEAALDVDGHPFEAVKDLATDLVWGKAIDHNHLIFHIESAVAEWAEQNPDQAGGYTDWRPPTAGEVLEAVENGLVDPDFGNLDFSYAMEHQGVDAPVDPSDPSSVKWGDKWFNTTCVHMQGKRYYRYRVQYRDGNAELHHWGFPVIPVRYAGDDPDGGEPNHDGCPKTKGSDIPDIPGKGKPPKE